MSARELQAWINQTRIGSLREANGLWAFAYSADWLATDEAFALCPSLPLQASEHVDGSSLRPVQWYFDNLLPEEGQRQLLATATRTSAEDAFGLLELYGPESAGSLTLLPPGQQPQPGNLLALQDQELSRRITAMPEIPLAQQAAKRMSLAGAQHKVAVVLQDDHLLEPTGNTASSHILKPDHPGPGWPHSVINEWFVMTLAARVGLPVPKVQRRYVPQPVYLVERFDRRLDGTEWQRLHCIDACQLLGLDRQFKYSAGSIERLSELASLCRPAAQARLQLFQWLVFNALVGNEDAHLKNLSFLPRGSQPVLAPFYDLLCTAVYGTRACGQDRWPQQATLAWPVLGISQLPQVDAPLLVRTAEAMGIQAGTARRLIARLVEQVPVQAAELLQEVEASNAQLAASRPELRATLAGELRLLRAVLHVIIQDMSVQLQR